MEKFGVRAVSQFTQVNRERLSKLAEWVDQNKVKENVEKSYALHEAGKALDYLRDIHPRVKLCWQFEKGGTVC
jgi:NADPH:quinone reductase-like Zn-dependent oxidoreductase